MPYALQERGCEFNDEYFELRDAFALHTVYDTESQARAEWAALERRYLEDMALMQREPLSYIMESNETAYQTLLNKLTEFGSAPDDTMLAQIAQNYYYADNEQLQLHRLNDEQLLDLLLATGCHLFCLTYFESPDTRSRYVLQFLKPKLSDFVVTHGGYLPTTYDDYAYGIHNASHPDDLFKTQFFDDIEPDRPLLTLYTDDDEQSVLLQSLLSQYDSHFSVVNNDSTKALHYLGGHTQALQAVNEVLVHPYFNIHQVSLHELDVLKQEQERTLQAEIKEREARLLANQNRSFFGKLIKRLFG